MKILPPVTEWLPALARSRTGRRTLVASGAGLVALALALTGLLGGGTVNMGGTAAMQTARDCSALVLDRGVHVTRAAACSFPPAAADAAAASGQPLARSDQPAHSYQLTEADRAIRPPEALRTSVWDVDVARSPARDAVPETTAKAPVAPAASTP